MSDLNQKFTPNGTSDDLVSLIVRAHALSNLRNSTLIPVKSHFSRWMQPIGHLIGLAAGSIAYLMPANKMAALQCKIWLKLGTPVAFPFESQSPHLIATKQLIAQVEAQTGLKTATLCLFEHPPVDGELMKLNFALVNHAFSALNCLQEKPGRPKLLVAIDSFALEHWSSVTEAIYAGFMTAYHLGLDRLSTHRRGLSRFLLGETIPSKMPFRISRTLHRRIGLAMAHTGGIPTTGRALYAAREYLYLLRQQRDQSITPEAVLSNLRRLSPDFAAFQDGGLVGAQLQHSAWKMMEAWIVAFLLGVWGFDITKQTKPCVDTGLLCPQAMTALIACAQAMGIKPEIANHALVAFAEEFQREVPQRIRLFRLLAQRVVAKGTPMLLLPLAADQQTHSVRWCEPVVLMGYADQKLTISTLKGEKRSLSVEAFAREFNRAHFK